MILIHHRAKYDPFEICNLYDKSIIWPPFCLVTITQNFTNIFRVILTRGGHLTSRDEIWNFCDDSETDHFEKKILYILTTALRKISVTS